MGFSPIKQSSVSSVNADSWSWFMNDAKVIEYYESKWGLPAVPLQNVHPRSTYAYDLSALRVELLGIERKQMQRHCPRRQRKLNALDSIAKHLYHNAEYRRGAILRYMLDDCEASHGPECHRKPIHDEASTSGEIILINVQKNCLERATYSYQYLALSYVWGKIPQFHTTKANLPNLLREGSLSDHMSEIPRVIQDSIDLVRELDYGYLWVDALCIVQDDILEKHTQILNMGKVYSASAVTLVALSGHNASEKLLPEVDGTIKAPWQHPEIRAEPIQNVSEVAKSLSQIIASSVYNQRGWTLQERLLSRRHLYVHHNAVYIHCPSQVAIDINQSYYWRSDDELYGDNIIDRKAYLAMLDPFGTLSERETYLADMPWRGHFQRFANLVGEYSQKQLTFPSDILGAFSGILDAFHTQTGWTFSSGLPVNLVYIALLWTPSHICQRRMEGVVDREGFAQQVYPSWSWIGWVGPVDFNVLFDHDMIGNIRSELRHIGIGETDVLSNPNMTERPAKVIKTSEGQSSSAHLLMHHELMLQFEGWSISAQSFSFRKHKTENFSTHSQSLFSRPDLYILDTDSKSCGIIYGIDHQLLENAHGTIREFVLISKIHDYSSIKFYGPMRGFDPDCFEHGPWCTLNILLVERRGDYVQRVAVGRMHSAAWERQNPNLAVLRMI